MQSHIWGRGFLIYEEMRKYFPYMRIEEAVSHIWLCNCSTLNFLLYEENLIFFFISACSPSAQQPNKNVFSYFSSFKLIGNHCSSHANLSMKFEQKFTKMTMLKKYFVMPHCKKRLPIFLSPSGMSLNKLSLAGKNVIFPARKSLVSDIPAGGGKFAILFFTV